MIDALGFHVCDTDRTVCYMRCETRLHRSPEINSKHDEVYLCTVAQGEMFA